MRGARTTLEQVTRSDSSPPFGHAPLPFDSSASGTFGSISLDVYGSGASGPHSLDASGSRTFAHTVESPRRLDMILLLRSLSTEIQQNDDENEQEKRQSNHAFPKVVLYSSCDYYTHI